MADNKIKQEKDGTIDFIDVKSCTRFQKKFLGSCAIYDTWMVRNQWTPHAKIRKWSSLSNQLHPCSFTYECPHVI